MFVADDTSGVYDMFNIQDHKDDATHLKVYLNEVPIEMLLDTGAALSIINTETFRRIQQHSSTASLCPSQARLQTYTGQPIPVLGAAEFTVRYGTTEASLSAQVVDGAGPNLLGRDWLNRLGVTPGHVNLVEHDTKLKEVLDRHADVFDGGLGCLKDVQIDLTMDEKVKPKFFKPRTVPFVWKTKVEEELTRLEQQGIISPVKHSQWAAPIVPVPKKDGSVRICGDFKVTVNQASLTEQYPLPRAEDLFADLSGGKYFTKLDLSNAYLQLPLSNAAKKYVTINTHKAVQQTPIWDSICPGNFSKNYGDVAPGSGRCICVC